jgi:enterobacteria phage integrase
MSRPRKSRRDDTLPRNLYETRPGYFMYQEPAHSPRQPGRRHPLGHDRAAAIEAAKELNSHLAVLPSVQRVLDLPAQQSTFRAFSTVFETDMAARVAADQLSANTAIQYRRNLAIYARTDWSAKPIHLVTTFDVAQWLDTQSAWQAKHHRTLLISIFALACAKGYCHSNPVTSTRAPVTQVKRQRLSLAQFDAILALANPILRTAMVIGLHTGLRREDIHAIKYADVRDGRLYVQPQKTRAKTGHAMALELPPVVLDAIKASRGDVVSEYVLHYGVDAPARRLIGKPPKLNAISKWFLQARDAAGVCVKVPRNQRPSFHEIRALAAHLADNPQELLGHADAKTTKTYLGRRGVTYKPVKAGVNVGIQM